VQPNRYILTMRKLATSVLLPAFMLLAGASHAAPQVIDLELKDASRERTIPIKVRVPDGNSKAPLVIFSHGLGGSVEGGKHWGEHWSANGYLVVHVQHPGSDTNALRETLTAGDGAPKQRMRNIATPENLVGRVDDIRFLISEIERQQRSNAISWMSRVDVSRIAMAGHSFGAHTTMALAGQRFPGPVKTLSDPRIKAFIALSPNATGQPRTFAERYGEMSAPFLSITGTRDADPFAADRNMKKMVEKRTALFEHQPAGDKYLFVINDADHMVFNGNEAQSIRGLRVSEPMGAADLKRVYDAVNRSTLTFLDAYLRDDAKAKAKLREEAAKALSEAGEWKAK
jgi:predicted dienelactone hydrolase